MTSLSSVLSFVHVAPKNITIMHIQSRTFNFSPRDGPVITLLTVSRVSHHPNWSSPTHSLSLCMLSYNVSMWHFSGPEHKF